MSDPSTTDQELLDRFKAGSESAARELFDKYCERLMSLARRRIGQRMASRLDPEDVVQSAFRTFFVHARNDEFRFQGGDDMLRLLVRITVNKALRQIAYHRAAKRDPHQEAGQGTSSLDPLADVIAGDPTPAAEVALIEEFEIFLRKLTPFERDVLERKIAGHSSAEIAEQLGSYERKIRRVLERVRELGGLSAEVTP